MIFDKFLIYSMLYQRNWQLIGIGFKEFQQANKNFEYRIIFDASLQKRQQELLENIKKLEK